MRSIHLFYVSLFTVFLFCDSIWLEWDISNCRLFKALQCKQASWNIVLLLYYLILQWTLKNRQRKRRDSRNLFIYFASFFLNRFHAKKGSKETTKQGTPVSRGIKNINLTKERKEKRASRGTVYRYWHCIYIFGD